MNTQEHLLVTQEVLGQGGATWQKSPQLPRDYLGSTLSPSITLYLCVHSWVLYEKPEFQGQKLVLPEGEVELRALGSAWKTQGVGSLRRGVRVSGCNGMDTALL